MRLNANFSERALVKYADSDWVASPMPGVDRKMLDRIGEEVARATSIVRYAPGSAFSPHTHDGGEEFLVLDGTFVDENGSYPAGTYVRNPPMSQHTPSAPDGTIILVKLHQFDPNDRQQIVVQTDRTGQTLFEMPDEHVRIETWEPGSLPQPDKSGGAEFFVLDGGFSEGGDTLEKWDWLRIPCETETRIETGPKGARVWVKSGHLARMVSP